MKKRYYLISLAAAVGASGFVTSKLYKNKTKKQNDSSTNKFKMYYNMLNQWLGVKQKGKSLDAYFAENGYKNIAIYGMGEMGNRLYEELKDTDVNVLYAIDKDSDMVRSIIDNVYGIEDEWPEADVIVVSAVFAYDEILSEIRDKCDCPIVSLVDVVYEI